MKPPRQITPMQVTTWIGALVMVLFLAEYFVRGGIPQLSPFRNVLVWAVPFTVIVASIRQIQGYFSRLKTTGQRKFESLVYFVFFAATVIAGLTLGTGNANYTWYYNTLANGAGAGLLIVEVTSLVTSFMRYYSRLSALSIMMFILGSLALFTNTPIAGMISQSMVEAGNWFVNYVAGNVYFGFYIGLYVVTIIFVIRLLLMKEKVM